MKLLSRSIRSYLAYAAIVLVVAIPVFYFVVQRAVAAEVDEILQERKLQTVQRLGKIRDSIAPALLEASNPDFSIAAITSFEPLDSLYTITVYEETSGELVPFRVLECRVIIKDRPYTMTLKNSLAESDDLIANIVPAMSILLLAIVAGLIIINRRISKKIWRPFYTTLDRLREYRVDSTDSLQFEQTDIDEFAGLNLTVAALSRRNQQVFQLQKEFAENASHEMQTPLAIFQSKLELLMQTSPMNEEQAQLISDLTEASHRMARLNKGLVLLSKIGNQQFTDKVCVSVNNIVAYYTTQYQPQIDQKKITVQTEQVEPLTTEASKALIEILVGNLLGNAIKHNRYGGTIKIFLQDKTLSICNTSDMGKLDEQKIFSRFYKDSADPGSIGLGLEIVRRICDHYGYTISYEYNDRMHCFITQFV